ncbi:hypothetical protein DXA36_22585 [Eisenbergiella sp. OF01-20]|nr:hypothetical protein DXA36_22585 [Eisenbergiella sp. OF01-20]
MIEARALSVPGGQGSRTAVRRGKERPPKRTSPVRGIFSGARQNMPCTVTRMWSAIWDNSFEKAEDRECVLAAPHSGSFLCGKATCCRGEREEFVV